MTPTRRGFLTRLASALSGLLAARARGSGATAAFATPSSATTRIELGRPERARRLDPTLLRAVGHAVLPEELGDDGRDRAVASFESWLAGFRPEAEGRHPYGGWVIPIGPGDPEPRWTRQLRALDDAARSDGLGFASRSVGERRRMIEAQLGGAASDLPSPAEAEHIAVGVMAHYFRSREANDRCFGRAIDKLSCRSIHTAGEPPPPVSG